MKTQNPSQQHCSKPGPMNQASNEIHPFIHYQMLIYCLLCTQAFLGAAANRKRQNRCPPGDSSVVRIQTIKQRHKHITQYPAVLSVKHTHTHKRRGWREEERQGPTSHRGVRYISLCRDPGGVGNCILVSGGPQAEGRSSKRPREGNRLVFWRICVAGLQ